MEVVIMEVVIMEVVIKMIFKEKSSFEMEIVRHGNGFGSFSLRDKRRSK